MTYATPQLLTARTLKVSVQNELQHLVMRLNFNGFYSLSSDAMQP